MKKILSVLAIVVALTSVAAIGCDSAPTNRQKEVAAQEDILTRGLAKEPPYLTQNFQGRKTVNAWLEDHDKPNMLFYVYLLSDAGAFIGFFVVDTMPLSYGVSLTNSQKMEKVYAQDVDKDGNPRSTWNSWWEMMPAPGLDGLYYQGTDPSVHYARDAETGTWVTWSVEFVFFTKPLVMNVPRLRLAIE